MKRRLSCFLAAVILVATGANAHALEIPGPLADLNARMRTFSARVPGDVGIAVRDLATGSTSGVNSNVEMPAASTIKIPVMVEVFRQMSLGNVELPQLVTLRQSDKDWGWGDLADARVGKTYPVSQLLSLMITESDNTATNMLIRLVGRHNINKEMSMLGLEHTRLGDYIRSEGNIRSLRTSPLDMLKLLSAMAQDKLIDDWSSRAMISILAGQHHNSLLPQPLPSGTKVAHKTGTLHDTLNDVGIVYLDQEPYVIAVMTTHLPTLDTGRRFIRGVSRMAFDALSRFADWRVANGLPGFDPALTAAVAGEADTVNRSQPFALPADLQMWQNGASTVRPGGEEKPED